MLLFFKIIWKIQKGIIKLSAKPANPKMKRLLYFTILVFVSILSQLFSFLSTGYFINTITMGAILLGTYFLLDWCYNLFSYQVIKLTHDRSFAVFAFQVTFLFLIVSMVVSPYFIGDNPYILLSLFFLVPIITWSLTSLLANNEVALFINAIGSGIVGIIYKILSYFVTTLPESILLEFSDRIGFISVINIFQMIEPSYSAKNVINIVYESIILPLFLMFAIATILCLIKKRWIIKYNDGRDISELSIILYKIETICIEKLLPIPDFSTIHSVNEAKDLLRFYYNIVDIDDYISKTKDK